MSLTSLAELAASPLGLSEQECERSHSAKSIPTAEQSCESIGQTCPSLRTYENSQQQMFPELMSSAADSPARTSALQEKAQDSQASGLGCGESTPVLLAKYDPATSSWKTSQLCLDGDLARYSETWPRSGMTRSGIAYRLPTLAHLTNETGSGLLPTPVRRMSRGGAFPLDGGSNARAQLRRLLPTITRCGNYNRVGASKTSGDGLYTVLRSIGLWHGRKSLNSFVAWMMGYPMDWTKLQRSYSETPSSRKSRKS